MCECDEKLSLERALAEVTRMWREERDRARYYRNLACDRWERINSTGHTHRELSK